MDDLTRQEVNGHSDGVCIARGSCAIDRGVRFDIMLEYRYGYLLTMKTHCFSIQETYHPTPDKLASNSIQNMQTYLRQL